MWVEGPQLVCPLPADARLSCLQSEVNTNKGTMSIDDPSLVWIDAFSSLG